MSLAPSLKKGFKFEEAILMANFAKQAYEVFQYDDSNIEDSELKDIYNSINRNKSWRFVHSIRNDRTTVRGFVVRNKMADYQYTISLRGSIVTEGREVDLSNFISDAEMDLVNYGSMTDPRIKVTKGVFDAYTSISDQVSVFFKTLVGRITPKDLSGIELMTPDRKFACITALADAGSIRLEDADFDRQVQQLIDEAVKDGEIGNEGDLQKIINFLKDKVLAIEGLKRPLELYVAGHSLGGAMATFCALDLRRCLGSVEEGGLIIKVYTIGAAKVGNLPFANYYDLQIGEGMSYRVENLLDIIPQTPPEVPFPLSLLAPGGLRIGSFYLANCVGVGEVHRVIGLGSQGFSVDFGGALELFGGIPFPHSFDTYIELLEEQQQQFKQIWRPIQNSFGSLIQEQLQEQTREIKHELEELRSEIQGDRNGKGLAIKTDGGQHSKKATNKSAV